MTAQVMSFLMTVDRNADGWLDFLHAIDLKYDAKITLIRPHDNITVYRVDTTDEDIEYDCIDNPNIVIDWDWE